MNKLSPQEIFDTVVKHLRTQQVASMGPEGECKYRGDGGLMCAVGVLIPDEMYDTCLEMASVVNLVTAISVEGVNDYPQWHPSHNMWLERRKHILQHPWLADLLRTHETLLCSLQEVHDEYMVKQSHWEGNTTFEERLKVATAVERRLAQIALELQLEYTPYTWGVA